MRRSGRLGEDALQRRVVLDHGFAVGLDVTLPWKLIG